MSPLLQVSNLSMRFGGLLAVDSVSFDVAKDEVFAIIGPNGAGKTTVFNCVGGFYKPTSGSVALEGQPIHGLSSHKVAQKGLVRTFQNVRLFKKLTVLENLLVAQHGQLKAGFLSGLLNLSRYKQAEKEAKERAVTWLDFMGLTDRSTCFRAWVNWPKPMLCSLVAAEISPIKPATSDTEARISCMVWPACAACLAPSALSVWVCVTSCLISSAACAAC